MAITYKKKTTAGMMIWLPAMTMDHFHPWVLALQIPKHAEMNRSKLDSLMAFKLMDQIEQMGLAEAARLANRMVPDPAFIQNQDVNSLANSLVENPAMQDQIDAVSWDRSPQRIAPMQAQMTYQETNNLMETLSSLTISTFE